MVMLNALSEKLKKLNVNFIRIDGTTRSDLRAEYIERFQTKKSCQVAVLSLKGMLFDLTLKNVHVSYRSLFVAACNAAITLTAASLVVFAELDWNPSVNRI